MVYSTAGRHYTTLWTFLYVMSSIKNPITGCEFLEFSRGKHSGGTRESIHPAAAERHSSTLSDISRKTSIELVFNPDWNCSAFNKNIDHNYLQILDIFYLY